MIEDQQIKLVEFMIQFLQSFLQPFEEGLLKKQGGFLSHSLSSPLTMIVKCFEADQSSSYIQDNKMFEVTSSIKYLELQDIVNKKYANVFTQISYINEHDE